MATFNSCSRWQTDDHDMAAVETRYTLKNLTALGSLADAELADWTIGKNFFSGRIRNTIREQDSFTHRKAEALLGIFTGDIGGIKPRELLDLLLAPLREMTGFLADPSPARRIVAKWRLQIER